MVTQLRANPREKAKQLLSRLNKKGGVPPDGFFPVKVDRIVRLLGWSLDRADEVSNFSQPGDTAGDWAFALGECDPNKRTILIAKKTVTGDGKQRDLSPWELNFTTAHELGHAVLHAERVPCQAPLARTRERLLSRRGGLGADRTAGTQRRRRDPREWEADAFAAELLMPAKEVRDKFKESLGCSSLRRDDASSVLPGLTGSQNQKDDPRTALRRVTEQIASYVPKPGKSLCGYFGVSAVAMARRLEELGLVF